MKSLTTIVVVIIYCLVLAGCVAVTTYHGLRPIEPKPNSSRFYEPVEVASLRPTFKWKTMSPVQAVDLAIWGAYQSVPVQNAQAQNGVVLPGLYGGALTVEYDVRGDLVYSKEGILGGMQQVEISLAPSTVYFWSIKPTGTSEWSTANHYAQTIGGAIQETTSGKKLFFLIKTPKN